MLDHAFFLKTALNVSEYGTCSRLRVGAVLVQNNRIVSVGYNGSASGLEHCNHTDNSRCSKSVHGEANAILFCAKAGIKTEGATMYCTHCCCGGCSGLLINAGIKKFVYLNEYRSTQGIEELQSVGIEVIKFEERWIH